MTRFETILVAGQRAPYTTWTFIEVPAAHGEGLCGPVRGELAGTPFRGTASRSHGVLRIPVTKSLLDLAGVSRGDRVLVSLEPDREPRPIEVPVELRAVLDTDPGLAAAFEALPPSHRRAWAAHVDEAKRPETRARRSERARQGIRSRAFP